MWYEGQHLNLVFLGRKRLGELLNSQISVKELKNYALEKVTVLLRV